MSLLCPATPMSRCKYIWPSLATLGKHAINMHGEIGAALVETA